MRCVNWSSVAVVSPQKITGLGGVADAADISPVRLVLRLVSGNLVLLLLLMLMFGYHGPMISGGEGAYEMVGRVFEVEEADAIECLNE